MPVRLAESSENLARGRTSDDEAIDFSFAGEDDDRDFDNLVPRRIHPRRFDVKRGELFVHV